MTYTRKKTSSAKMKPTILSKTFELADIVYNKPKTYDMAVGLAYFNANKSKRILMNYLYTVEKLRQANIPYFTIEMYKDHIDIKDAVHVKTDFILFQKERLYRVLETHIPKKYTKLFFIDGDIVFDNINWYNDMSNELNSYDVVHGFKRVARLNITYNTLIDERVSYVLRKEHGIVKYIPNTRLQFVPGGAWGFTRAWYNKVGFFEDDILGGSDSYSVNSWGLFPDTYYYPPHIRENLKAYREKMVKFPSVSYIDGTIFHLWHGSEKNKQYRGERFIILKGITNMNDILTTDRSGIFKLKNTSRTRKIRKNIMKYFMKRQDDSIE